MKKIIILTTILFSVISIMTVRAEESEWIEVEEPVTFLEMNENGQYYYVENLKKRREKKESEVCDEYDTEMAFEKK